MEIVRRECRVPVRNQTDVLVVGGGPAGFGAAIAAARAGMKVSLVEQSGMLGGMWTLGLLSPFFDNRNKEGLNRELRERLQSKKAWGGLWDMSFDPIQMAFLLDDYATEHHLDLLLHSVATEPILDGNQIRGIIVENKSGAQAILARVVIDCTGDGDIAARAGAPFEVGRAGDHICQPMTTMFRIAGLREDYPRDETLLWYQKLIEQIPEDEVLQQVPFNHPALIRLPNPGEALIQWTHVRRHSGIDADDLTAAEIEGRRQVRNAMKLFEKIRPVLGDVRLIALPSVIGVRETRRITGEHVISDDEVRQGVRPEDTICVVRFGVDIHEPDNRRQTCWGHPGFGIPYRSLVPLKVENLLTAGRCISGSFTAHAAYRVTGDCLETGEAAGKAAALAIREQVSVRSLCGKYPAAN